MPQGKEKLPPESKIPERTLSLKPDNNHIYGRVTSVIHSDGPGEVGVDFMKESGQIKTINTIQPYFVHKELQAGDAVLLKKYGDYEEAMKDDREDAFPILMVYNNKEEAQLRSRGVTFPECPPNLHPGGYYG